MAKPYQYPPFKTDDSGNILVKISGSIPAGEVTITDDTTTNATMYPMWVTTTTGNLPVYVSSTKLNFNPSSGLLTSTALSTATLKSTGAAYQQKPVVANSGSAYTIDQANGAQFDITLNAATPVLTLQSVTASQAQILYVTLIQDATGARAPTWANVTWETGLAPTINPVATGRTYFIFISDGTTWTGYTGFQMQVNAQTGTTYTLVATDNNNLVTFNNASAITVTLPQQSTLKTVPGFNCWFQNLGAGTITFVKEGAESLTGNPIAITATSGKIWRNTTTNWNILAGSATVNEQITGSAVGTIVNQAYDISVYMPFAGTILGIATKSTTTAVAGTYTVAISGASVTGLTTVANGASGVRTYTSATAANTFVRGDYVTITLAGATITDLFWMLEYTRVY